MAAQTKAAVSRERGPTVGRRRPFAAGRGRSGFLRIVRNSIRNSRAAICRVLGRECQVDVGFSEETRHREPQLDKCFKAQLINLDLEGSTRAPQNGDPKEVGQHVKSTPNSHAFTR